MIWPSRGGRAWGQEPGLMTNRIEKKIVNNVMINFGRSKEWLVKNVVMKIQLNIK